MRKLLTFATIFSFIGFCFSDTITKPYDFVAGTVIKASEVNENFDTIYDEFNGNIDSNNIKDGSISSSDLGEDIIYSYHIVDGTITETDLDIANAPTTNNVLYFNGTKMQWADVTTLSGVISGSGTAGKIPKFSSSTVLTDSSITDTGNTLTIDKTTVDFNVNYFQIGNGSATGTYSFAGYGATASTVYSFAFGYANSASGNYAINIGGVNNTSSGSASGILGGVLNVASGECAGIVGGAYNTASGNHSFATGHGNTSSTGISFSEGKGANAYLTSQHSHSSGNTGATGDGQWSYLHVIAETSASETDIMYPDNDSDNKLVIPSDTAWYFIAKIIGKTTSTDVCSYELRGILVRDTSNNTTLKGLSKTVFYEDLTGADVTAVADDTNEALSIIVTGGGSAMTWSAKLELVEVYR